jgi:Lrp/AsnC family transcriptional regulator for asnA, asnC and gidA
VLWVDRIPEFFHFWDDLNEKYGDYFDEKIFSVYFQDEAYPLSFLLSDKYEKSDRDKYKQTTHGKSVEIDYIDYQLLNYIVENARIPLVELAGKLGCSSQTVSYRIKNLKKNGVIQAFRVDIDFAELGFQEIKVDIWLEKPSKKRQLHNFIKNNPYVTFISLSAGYADIEIVFTINDSDKLLEILEDSFSKFPGVIKKYIYWTSKKAYRYRCLPNMEKRFK